MKFSKTLSSHLTPEWRSQYIDYSLLKEILEEAAELLASSPSANVTYLEEHFFRGCQQNLDKVNSFFNQKLSESRRKHIALKADDGSEGRQSVSRVSLETQRNKKSRRWMLFSYSEHYLNLTLLKNYQYLNSTGFRKILKKHDKIFQNTLGLQWYSENVMTAPFYTSKIPSDLMVETEDIVTYSIFNGDRSAAMKRLRVPPLHDIIKPVTLFFAGCFLGISLVLLCFCIFGPPIDHPADFAAQVQLFMPLSLLIIYTYLLAGNVFGWRAAGVNHILIFEIDPRNHLTAIEFLLIAGTLSVIFTLCLVGFIYCKKLNTPRYVFPLLMYTVALIYFVNPFPICYRSTRYWLLYILGRAIIAPFAFVNFPDFWVADQLSSMVGILTGVVYVSCFYLNLKDWQNAPNNDKCTASNLMGLFIIAKILPAWCRFWQNLRRYYNFRVKISLINAAKYFVSMLTVILYMLNGEYRDRFSDQWANPVTVLFLTSAICLTIFSLVYDFVVDWGFCEKNVFIRNQLVYSPKFVYVLAAIENTIARCIWAFFLVVTEKNLFNPYIVFYASGYVEVFRRFVWNFFRLENEHLNNVGNFRAVRDIYVKTIETSENDVQPRTSKGSGGSHGSSEEEENNWKIKE